MSYVKGLLKRFQRDQRGNVAMMFGLAAIPMVAAAGTAIDYGRLSSSQAKIHAALDAAVLAVARDPSISVDPSTTAGQLTRTKIQNFFAANLYDKNLLVTPNVVLKPTTSDKVLVEVTGCVKMAFVGVTGIMNPCVKATSEVTRGGSVKLEVALVMDNSGSMDGTKMSASKDAAKDFAKVLFDAAITTDQVKISVIPFAHTVNTGLSRTSPSMDGTGASPIHWENLLNPGDVKPASVTSRFNLFDQLGETWGGCVETRPGNYGTNDDGPSISIPSSLFVPYFAPDEPGDKAQSSVSKSLLNEYGASGGTFNVSNTYLNDDGGSNNTHNGSTGLEIGTSSPACTSGTISQIFNRKYTSSTTDWQNKNFLWRLKSNMCRYNLTGTSGGSSARKSVGTSTYYAGFPTGPNYMCHAAPLQRITSDKAILNTKIDAMVAKGSTNILDGFMWGWRTISPNAPFSDGRSYTWTDPQYKNKKVIVLMTDGDNTWNEINNGALSLYSPNGYYGNNRLATGITTEAQARAAMDTKTLEACNNAKAKRTAQNEPAITIYTIGFSTADAPISSTGKTLLENCASVVNGQKLYYPAKTAAELKSVFAGIAAELAKMKLSK